MEECSPVDQFFAWRYQFLLLVVPLYEMKKALQALARTLLRITAW